ncbi:hypothetical protein [Aquisediminimonas sediminicola]|uniref:hypothetical protein n=1 Tax=Alteraquisediminimonas sediminicola TaxID=2676787 RepID=UPI001C8D7B11|nr:hypothetical protein [Aquisediminimonas sediminicola]
MKPADMTEADREAAKPFIGRMSYDDEQWLLQHFAAHRIAAFEAGRVAGLEEAAMVCENWMADCLDDRDIQRRWPVIKQRNVEYAQAIRALKEKQ